MCLTVLDSISTFGGMEVRADEWGADYVIGYASKAIGGIFGAQPVAIGPRSWEKAKQNKARIHSLFLDLNTWRKSIEQDGSWGHPYPSSMPTSVIVALSKAVDLALKEGLKNRYERHAKAASRIREGLVGMGLEIFTDERFLSNTVSVARVEPGLVGLSEKRAPARAPHHDLRRARRLEGQDNQDRAHGDRGQTRGDIDGAGGDLRVAREGAARGATHSGRLTAFPSSIDLFAATAVSTAAFPSCAVALVSVSLPMHSMNASSSSL